MTDIQYVLTSEIINTGEKTVKSYGILCIVNSKEYLCFSDILPDKKKIRKLVRLCNKLELYPVHLQNVIEDLLAQ